MPLIDMPLEKLRSYKGSSPCPKDIDKFWDSSIAEMKAIDPEVELLPSDFQAPYAECFDMYFTGVGGARVFAKLLRPKPLKKKHPAIVMFHGYSGNSGDWCDKLPYVAAGFTVAALDCRGQAGNSEDVGGVIGNTFKGQIIRGLDSGPEKMLFRQIYLDCAQLAGLVMQLPEVDATRVAAMGGSQGGGLTLACASLEPRICRAAPVFPFLCDYKRIWDMDLDINAYAELREYFRWFDPTHSREDEVFRHRDLHGILVHGHFHAQDFSAHHRILRKILRDAPADHKQPRCGRLHLDAGQFIKILHRIDGHVRLGVIDLVKHKAETRR